MKYNLNYGEKKSIRYQFIKELFSRYQLQTHDLQGLTQGSSRSPAHPQSSMDNTQKNQLGSQSGSQLGSGLNGEAARSHTKQYIFLPSDPDE